VQKIWVSWSSGKDSAWTLHRLLQRGEFEVAGLVTTISKQFQRVSMHGVRLELVRKQAAAVGLPLHVGELPWPCPNTAYEEVMQNLCLKAREEGVTGIAFGDLHLEDIRAYREERMNRAGLKAIFPLWATPTDRLIFEMLSGGLKATITCVDTQRITREWAGVELELPVVDAFPDGIDPCGENGEFHTFVWDLPCFSTPIFVQASGFYQDGPFVFRDLVEAAIKDEEDMTKQGG